MIRWCIQTKLRGICASHLAWLLSMLNIYFKFLATRSHSAVSGRLSLVKWQIPSKQTHKRKHLAWVARLITEMITFQVPKIQSIAYIYCIDIAFMQCRDNAWIMAPCFVNSFIILCSNGQNIRFKLTAITTYVMVRLGMVCYRNEANTHWQSEIESSLVTLFTR